MSRKKPSKGSALRTFGVPAVIAAISVVGLVAALVGDGVADWISWLGLFVPVAVIVWAMKARRS